MQSSEDDAGLADADDAGVVFCPLGTLAGTLVLPGIAASHGCLSLLTAELVRS
ncbi:MAG: hypothetical protein U5O39_10815 [Gammaproteobacteria bacterium]|nr:hypothetical protein [Gammaproteobacteria bacterium]